MISTLKQWDEECFLWLNSHHNELFDGIMWYASKMWFWIPVYALMIFMVFKRKSPVNAWIALLCIALLLFLTDYLAVKTIKETVMRLRPSHNPRLNGLVHMVKDELGNVYRGGKYGFFSNHASNFAGVATFFTLIIRPIKSIGYLLIFSWVLFIAYSRIYLGVHYPLDIIAGLLYGVGAAICMYYVYRAFEKRKQ